MTNDDELDEILEQSPVEAQAWFKKAVRTEGVRTAYEAALAVCRDPKAPAPARATMAGLLLRAAGMLTKVDDSDETPIAEMTRAQMQAELSRLDAEAKEIKRSQAAADAPASNGAKSFFS